MRSPDLLNIGYFADGPWSYGTLDLLKSDPRMKILFICARYKNPDENLRSQAKEIDADFLIEKDVNSASFAKKLKSYNADIFVSMSFDQILRKHIFEIPKHGTINCHASRLPKYRGRNVLNWAIINDEKEFGITVHYIDSGIDTGDIILQEVFPINEKDNYQTLLSRAFVECPKILYKAICQILEGNASRIQQDSLDEPVLICCKRLPGDELINWSQTSREIYNFVRALCPPGPSATTTYNGIKVKINKAEAMKTSYSYKGVPGAILSKEKNGFIVKTLDSYVKIIEWEAPCNLIAGGRFQ